MQVPANYYDDLDARLAPPPAQLSALRELNVLLDRNADGEFLHFYTEVLGGRVFFEVVQRIGDYQGYGETNSPVRMAAHRRQRTAAVRTRRNLPVRTELHQLLNDVVAGTLAAPPSVSRATRESAMFATVRERLSDALLRMGAERALDRRRMEQSIVSVRRPERPGYVRRACRLADGGDVRFDVLWLGWRLQPSDLARR